MNKVFTLMVLVLMVVSFIGPAIAAQTVITGKIYNSDYTDVVEGAYVEATCDKNVQNVTSTIGGDYAVVYDLDSCHDGSDLMVFASHPDYGFGTKGGIVHNSTFGDWDFAVVNVPLVPEFGFFVGALTIISAMGAFFIIRRH